jgi:polysaccharide export outer membrane protein
VDEYLKETTVIVKLAIFKVTVIGEVNRPGTVNIYQNKLNVFELISMAGDLTSFAKRNKVYLIRETQNGSKVKELNLNDVNILESDYYYIQPDDILYVPPVKAKNFAFGNFPYALIFTTITTTLLLINFFQTN